MIGFKAWILIDAQDVQTMEAEARAGHGAETDLVEAATPEEGQRRWLMLTTSDKVQWDDDAKVVKAPLSEEEASSKNSGR